MSKTAPETAAQASPLPQGPNENGRISPGYWNGFSFKKELKGMNPPMTKLEDSYVQRKQACKEELFTLTNGRSICYVVDGPGKEGLQPSDDSCHIVLCLHGSMCNKWQWLQEKKFENVCQVMIDRIGHGGSSPAPKPSSGSSPEGTCNYGYEVVCADLKEFMEEGIYKKLNLPESKKYFVIGHSMGATIALELSACPETRGRIAGCVSSSGPAHMSQSAYDPEDWKAVSKHHYPMRNVLSNSQGLNGGGGCVSKICCPSNCCHFRWSRVLLYKMFAFQKTPKDCDKKSGDWGVNPIWDQLVMGEGDEKGQKVMMADRFQCSALLDCIYPGHLTKDDGYTEFARCFGKPWYYHLNEISCPVFIYNGTKEEVSEAQARQHGKQINRRKGGEGQPPKNATVIIWDGHGHNSLNAEYGRIINALVGNGFDGKPSVVEKPLWEL